MTQPSHAGRRASQTRRPCQISRCGKRAQSARGTSRIRSRSIFTGSSWRVNPSRWESRRTWVSTTIPWASPRSAETTLAVLRATPGSRRSASKSVGHLAPVLGDQDRHRPAQRLRLLAEEPRLEDVPLELLLRERRGSPRACRYLRNSFSVTRLTFTSVVWAESITETSSSSGFAKRSAIRASACSAASRSITGRIRSRFGPTFRRASCDVAPRHRGSTLAHERRCRPAAAQAVDDG